jgi:hypothetical protein
MIRRKGEKVRTYHDALHRVCDLIVVLEMQINHGYELAPVTHPSTLVSYDMI